MRWWSFHEYDHRPVTITAFTDAARPEGKGLPLRAGGLGNLALADRLSEGAGTWSVLTVGWPTL